MALDAVFSKDRTRLVLVQGDASQNPLPILRHALYSSSRLPSQSVILLSLCTPATYFRVGALTNVQVISWEEKVPTITDWNDPISEILEVVANYSTSTALSIVCESVDTLIQDYGSLAQAYKRLKALMSIVQDRPAPSRLFLSVASESPLIPLLSTPSFSPSISWIVLHSPLLVRHIAVSYLMPPPPYSLPAKFWALFSPAAARGEGERLAFSSSLSADEDEVALRGLEEGVVEVISRGISSSSSKRGIERTLEGWRLMRSTLSTEFHVKSVPWNELTSLSKILPKPKLSSEISSQTPHPHPSSASQGDPMATLSFNLNLTDEQQAARAQVPLPYVHGGQTNQSGLILYDPDSADDVDDDDPDEDLDI